MEHTTVTHDWPVDDLDGIRFDPLLARLLAEEPISRIRLRFGEGDAWLVTRYEDVRAITTDPRFSRAATVDNPITSMTPHVIGLPGGIARTDPPEHTRLRGLVTSHLSSRRVRRLRPRAQVIADDLLTRVQQQGPPADLAECLTTPFTMRVISELLGIPEAHWDRAAQWQAVVLSSSHSRTEADEVKAEIGRYFAQLARRRAEEPGEDLLSALVSGNADGALSTRELVSLAAILLLNGMDMVRNVSTSMVFVLLSRPELMERLRAEPEVLPQVVEELFRYLPQRNGVGLPRVAMADVEIGGVTIRAGEAVYVSYLTANRDPEVFDQPDRLDVDREDNPHMAFGHGPHHCIGAALTRMQLDVLIPSLLTRLPGLRLTCAPEEVSWRRGTLNRGPVTLPATWDVHR
ncbi:cytochrome P450 [Umezawaea beigongshangensis]|uniref:cytochrome P450 n=1 Tax=Umezawaea beigongshangensis TaxID=2780383 RepID=UPI0018F189C9|nr:cytochrome P450 [Umezawaea beigongshangensis]